MNDFDRDSISLPAVQSFNLQKSYESSDNSSEPIANFVLSSDVQISQVDSVDVEGTLTWTSTGEERLQHFNCWPDGGSTESWLSTHRQQRHAEIG